MTNDQSELVTGRVVATPQMSQPKIIITGAILILVGLTTLYWTYSAFLSRGQALSSTMGEPLVVSPAATPAPTPTPTFTLMAVGDVMLGRSVNTRMLKYQDWSYPFRETADFLSSADLLFGNLESPFNQTCPARDDGMIFCADRRSVEGLMRAGFDVMSLANNHSLNQGRDGLDFSLELLAENGIAGLNFNQSTVVEKAGLKIGLIAFDDTMSKLDNQEVGRLVEALAAQSDLVLASFHWGDEYRSEPNPRQVELARLAVDTGATLVIGHHPHWIQTVEEYEGALILYSLGNFVFDQMWSEETRRGAIAVVELGEDGVRDYHLREVRIYDYAQPKLLPLDSALPEPEDG